VHAKDGLYPINGTQLGREVPLGEGKVNFGRRRPALLLGYAGTLTIEPARSARAAAHRHPQGDRAASPGS
jgi:sugar phosphate isomerase/epimerase